MATSSKTTQIYVAVGLLAVAGGVYFMNRKKDNEQTNIAYTQGSKSGQAPQFKIVADEIDKLVLKAKDKPEIVLEKKDSNWAMVSPNAGARIQKSAVDDLLNGLKGITFKDNIASGQASFAGYELDDAKGIHVVASKAGKPVIDLWLGKQASRGQLARLGDDAEGKVWSVGGVSAYTFDKAPKDVRDKKVWDLSRDAVTTSEIHDAKGTFVFAKATPPASSTGDAGADPSGDAGASAPSWTAPHEGKPLKALDTAKVDDFVNAYALGGVLNADDFGDGKSDAETGFASNDATAITFKTKEGTSQKIVLGKTDGTRRYARKEGDPTIYLLAEGPSSWADVGVDKFTAAPKDASDAGAAPAGKDSKAMSKEVKDVLDKEKAKLGGK
ncbi:MAG: hypothetical protein NVSMB1_05800 [Polyangiales bacterium]